MKIFFQKITVFFWEFWRVFWRYSLEISKLTTVYVSLSCADKKLKAAKIAGSVVFTSVKLLMTLLSTFAIPFRRNRLIPSFHFYSIIVKLKELSL